MPNAFSRIEMLIKGIKPDRIPFTLSFGVYAIIVCNITLKEFLLNPSVAYEANKTLAHTYPDDGSPSYYIPNGFAWDFGGMIEIPDGIYVWPKVIRYPITNKNDLKNLTLPDPAKAPAASLEIKYAQIHQKAGGKTGTVGTYSPLRQAFELVRAESVLKWMYKDPGLVHDICRVALEYNIKRAETFMANCSYDNWCAAVTYPAESHNLISPAMFREFSAPYNKEMHKRLSAMGVRQFNEHLCGNHRYNIPFFRDELSLPEHTIVSVGSEIPIEDASELLGDRLILAGNVNTTLMYDGTPEEVFNKTKEIVLKVKNRKGGFILKSACDIPIRTPASNILAVREAVEKYGEI